MSDWPLHLFTLLFVLSALRCFIFSWSASVSFTYSAFPVDVENAWVWLLADLQLARTARSSFFFFFFVCVWACVYDCSQVKLFSAVNPSSSFNSKGEYEALISLADALFCLRSFCFSVSRTLWGCWRAEFTLFSFFCLAFSLVNSFSLLLNFLTPHILFQCEFHFFFSFFFFQSVLLFPPSPFYLFIVGSISSFQSCKWCSYPFFPFGKRRNPHIRILLLLFCQCTSVQLGKTSLELLRSRKKKKAYLALVLSLMILLLFLVFFFPLYCRDGGCLVDSRDRQSSIAQCIEST